MHQILTVALIGSFKRNYDIIRAYGADLRNAGVMVTSPLGTDILEEGVPFVRFESDPVELEDLCVQTLTLHRILRADFTYIVAPEGYIGNTTCYEIGRLIQARKPIYFSEPIDDLPIYIPTSHILCITELLGNIKSKKWTPVWLYEDSTHKNNELERDLLSGNYSLY